MDYSPGGYKVIIHAYTLCFNEEKILPYYLAYYSQFCDKITIYDNESTDRSREIITSFPNTEIISWSSNNQIDENNYLKIKNNCWKQSRGVADIVIVGDTDEFLFIPNIKEFFAEKLEAGFTIFNPDGYTMISEKFPLSNNAKSGKLITDLIRTGVPSPGKVIAFSPKDIQEIDYAVGAHSLTPTGITNYYVGELKYLHYTLIDRQNILDRYERMSRRLSTNNITHRWGTHYQTPKDTLSKNFDTVLSKTTDVLYNYGLDKSYKTNVYKAFDDLPYKAEYQLPVYEFVDKLMQEQKLTSVLDIGCGSGYKLMNVLGKYQTIGAELSPTLEFLQRTYPDRHWVKSDLLSEFPDKVDVVMASDVIEHLEYPDNLILYMQNIGAKYIILSTPNTGSTLGPPQNGCHIREWTMPQFKAYILTHFKEEQITQHLFGNTQVICVKQHA
jgi:SAM-dependent methyltransferase